MNRKGHFPGSPQSWRSLAAGPGVDAGPPEMGSAGGCAEKEVPRLRGSHSDTDGDVDKHYPETRQQETQRSKSLERTVPGLGRERTLGIIMTILIRVTLFVTYFYVLLTSKRCTPYIISFTL